LRSNSATPERIEDRREPALIGAARLRQHELVGLALEQRDAEPFFQQMHHAADGGRRHAQLDTGRRKAAGPRRRLERLDAVEKEQPPQIKDPQES
jgi:hypothetical protein